MRVGIAQQFTNDELDIFVFDLNNQLSVQHLNCYKEAVLQRDWAADCGFIDSNITHVQLHQQLFSHVLTDEHALKSLAKHIVLDNTPYPSNSLIEGGGAFPTKDLEIMIYNEEEF